MVEIRLPEAVSALMAALEQAGYEAWAVGGCVRDSLIGAVPHDWDLTTSALPAQVTALFPQAIPTGLAHGTVTVPTADGPLEVTTFREETGYADHRRPDAVRFVTQIESDLARRDFTVNAMAWHPLRGLCDPCDGQGDLRRRLIRCVGDPERRFSEDALRMLRALRFAARLRFGIDAATSAAMRRHAPELCCVSSERIFAELCGLLQSDGAALGNAYPELLQAAAPLLRLPTGRHAMRTWLQQLGTDGARTLLDWCAAYGNQPTEQAQALLSALLREARQTPLAIGGRALETIGIAPGPGMGQMLQRLRTAVEAGTVENEPTALLALARQWTE